MNIYLVKEVQYEWVKVLKAFKSEKKAEDFCLECLKHKKVGILNYVVEIHILED